jgi:hypothetical protein
MNGASKTKNPAKCRDAKRDFLLQNFYPVIYKGTYVKKRYAAAFLSRMILPRLGRPPKLATWLEQRDNT